MRQIGTSQSAWRHLGRVLPPAILVATVSVGLSACGSSGGGGSSGMHTGVTGGQSSTSTSAPRSGGAGF